MWRVYYFFTVRNKHRIVETTMISVSRIGTEYLVIGIWLLFFVKISISRRNRKRLRMMYLSFIVCCLSTYYIHMYMYSESFSYTGQPINRTARNSHLLRSIAGAAATLNRKCIVSLKFYLLFLKVRVKTIRPFTYCSYVKPYVICENQT